jgi:hypothetical protein
MMFRQSLYGENRNETHKYTVENRVLKLDQLMHIVTSGISD